MTAGMDLRHDGQAANLAADTAAHRGYGELVREAVERMPRGTHLNADLVRQLIAIDHPGAAAHHPNVLPSMFGVLRNEGLMERIGESNSARRSRHGSRNAVWRRT